MIDGDLSGYSDSIPHAELMQCVARRVSDRAILHLIQLWLDAPVEARDARGHVHRTTRNKDEGRGTPQGAPISPLLSNLYMRRFVLGWKTLGHEQALDAHIVNYADDFVICCRGTAQLACSAMRDMIGRLKLTVNEQKTRVCRVPEETFHFLSYTFGRCYSPRTGRRVLILFVLDGLMMGYIMPVASAIMALAANNSVMPLDLMFFYSPAKAFAMLEKYGAAGRAVYMKIELTADIIYPIIYTLFYGLLLSWLFQRAFKPDSKMMKYNAMPVGAWLFDLLENIGIVSMLTMYPSQPAAIAWLTMICGSLKWLFALASIGLVLLGLVKAGMNRFKKQ